MTEPQVYYKIGNDIVNVKDVDVPKSSHFREAWVLDDGVIEVDMSKAREIHKEFLRRERTSKFQELDTVFIRAIEEGDDAKKAEAIALKQKLRDVTKNPKINSAKTPEDLEALTLEKLIPELA